MDPFKATLEEWDDDSNTDSEDTVLDEVKPSHSSSDWKVDKDGDPNDEFRFRVLSTDQVFKLMNQCISEGSSVLELAPNILRLLFNHFRWDKEKLLEAYFERDREQLLQEAGISKSLTDDGSTPPIPVVRDSNGMENCEICFSEVPSLDMYGMECGHRFCKECWERYLVEKIVDEGAAARITCAGHKCSLYLDDATVRTLVTEDEVKQRYERLMTNYFVQYNQLLRWCPAPDCANAIQVKCVAAEPVKCHCGHRMCFGCGKDWHAPAECNVLQRWEEKFLGYAMSCSWITVNTKKCPRCNAAIQKDAGCDHMVCTCRHQFCWTCLNPWRNHLPGPCTNTAPTRPEADQRVVSPTESSSGRHVPYFDCYVSQSQALEMEKSISVKIGLMEKQMHRHSFKATEIPALLRAVETLQECRQTLKYAYVFSYYVETNNQLIIFKDILSHLADSTETLAAMLGPDELQKTEDFVATLQDKFRYCEERRRVLLEHVREGNDNDWWIENRDLVI